MFGYFQTSTKFDQTMDLKSDNTSRASARKTKSLPLSLNILLLTIFLAFTFSQQPSFVRAETAGWDTMSTECKERLFPISSGGSKDEMVSCTVYDK
jgi:hypothetical protein